MSKRKKRALPIIVILGLVLFALFFIIRGKTLSDQRPSIVEEFCCFVYDDNNNQIDAFWSDKDKVWYMFVPSTVSIPDMALSYTGAVTAVSSGTLHEDQAVVFKAFSQRGDRVTLTDESGAEHVVQVMQSDLPSVHIVLNETTLSKIHLDKNIKYKNNSVYIMDPNGTYDLTVEDSVEMKGRGNTTWVSFNKKGYQIKFNYKTSVLGMGEAKKWLLLANAGDDSMMRTMLTYRMVENLGMDYVTSFAYVDLWVSGEYLGTYIMGEKVELGSSRLELETDLGVLLELDEAYYADEDYWFFSELLQRHFVMKEIAKEENANIEAAMADFRESVDEFAEYLYFTPSAEATLEELSSMIDVDSFIKYYLVAEYVLNREAIGSSFYWYKDGPDDVIHLGPLWDYDTCMGNDDSAYTESYAHQYLIFRYLLAIPEYYERTLELREEYRGYMDAMVQDADVLYVAVKESAAMNYLRWDVLGKPLNKDDSTFADTFEEAVAAVKDWLSGRQTAFSVAREAVVYTTITGDGKTMELYCDNSSTRHELVFAVWGVADGQNDLQWYQAQRDSTGIWKAVVDLTKHSESGAYMIDAYAGSEKAAVGQSYVSSWESKIDVRVSKDNATMLITYKDSQAHEQIQFPVWSDVNGQDDLKWYPAVQNETGQWECTVDLLEHCSTGIYNVHAYSFDEGVYSKQLEYRAIVEHLKTSVSADYRNLELTYADGTEHDQIRFAVWSEESGQDDLGWYEGVRNKFGQWEYTIDLRWHHSAGIYHIHAYSVDGGVQSKKQECSVIVEKATLMPLTAVVSEDFVTLELAYADRMEYEQIQFVVWSDENGQGDLTWYDSSINGNGEWVCSVDLRKHNSTGKYHIHVYSIADSVSTKLIEYSVNVEKSPN